MPNSINPQNVQQITPESIRKNLPTFFPASAGAENHPELILGAAERFPNALDELCRMFHQPFPVTCVEEFNTEKEIAVTLMEKFIYYKTDKAGHNYHHIYGEILSKLGVDNQLNILEIGIGNHNRNIVSHIEPQFQPGASLRAFRDVANNSKIYGADFDERVLFSEERIQTGWVDQMDIESFKHLKQLFGDIRYDLIIDDGLHVISANLNTLLFGLESLKPGGWIVIEDIWTGQICWNTVFQLIPHDDYNKFLLSFDVDKKVFALEKKK